MIKITINNESVEVATGSSVADVLASRGIDVTRGGVAAAVNDHLVTRARWAETKVNEGDNLVVINAAYGG